MLTSAFTRRFASASRKRGTSYYRNGRVSIERGSPDDVVAMVEGSETYEVVLGRKGARVNA